MADDMKSWNDLDDNVREFITTLRHIRGKEDSVSKEQAQYITDTYNELLKKYENDRGTLTWLNMEAMTVENVRRVGERAKEKEAEESGSSGSEEYDKIRANFSAETKAVLGNNISNYIGFNINPVKADYYAIKEFLDKHRVYTGDSTGSNYAAAQQGNTGGSVTKQAFKDKQTLDAFFTSFEKNRAAQASKNPPKEEAPERKEPELNIDQYSGPAAEVDVDNLVNGLSHADEVGYAKSTLDGTEDTLKDTGDYITARDKNLTKEEEKQYRADLDADVYGRNARINDNIARGSKGENANNRNFETTLRYSRLADALNNRVHTRASLPSVVSFSAFGPSANIAGQRAELYQMPKIETEEMRQMNTVRDLSKDQSGRQINRQQNYRDAAQELTANEMQDKLKLQTDLSKRLMDRRDKFTDEEMRQWYQTRYDEEMKRKATEWEKKFGRDFGIESARFIAEMNKADPTLAAIMGKALNIVPPDYVQQFLTEVLMPYGRAIRAGEPVSKVIERAAYDFGNFAANGLYGLTKGGVDGIMDAIKEILS